MKYKPITLPHMLTLSQIKIDTLKYLQLNNITRAELSFRIGCCKANLSRFLNTSTGFSHKLLLNLINLLYHEN